jgi:hypothetical protein
MRIFLGGYLGSLRKRFYDNFTRANQTGLGIASDGSTWSTINGSVNISGNTAVAGSAGSSSSSGFQLAAVDMPLTDAVIELQGTNNGSATALWVQNATDWWLVSQEAQGYSYSYTYFAGNVPWSYSTYYPAEYNLWSYTATGYTRVDAGIWTSYTYTVTGSSQVAAAYTETTSGYSPSYATGYASGVNYYLKIWKSVSGAVSAIQSFFIASDSIIRSLRVATSGNVITAQAFSDTALTNQLGSTVTYTATSPTTTSKYGVSLAASTSNQAYVVGTSVNVKENISFV